MPDKSLLWLEESIARLHKAAWNTKVAALRYEDLALAEDLQLLLEWLERVQFDLLRSKPTRPLVRHLYEVDNS